MLNFYHFITGHAGLAFEGILRRRTAANKEDPARVDEKRGLTTKTRPKGQLLWIHAASVGESQSALILIEHVLAQSPQLNILVTTGTKTSAAMMDKNLPKGAFHQFAPLDYPQWVDKFLDHWRPDLALWMESELWPNMLRAIKTRNIPAALINARLSEKSFKRWAFISDSAARLLGAFTMILTQTQNDADSYLALGAQNVAVTGNLKYSAAPLPFDKSELKALAGAISRRPVWLYASSHKGEEALACRVHEALKAQIPGLLTIIVPRHPERREDITATCAQHKLTYNLRSQDRALPDAKDDIYIADTLGELGLFYRLAPVAVIGRSFSDDGGGGHNPIEAAQLHCAVLSGPHVQYQQQLFDDMAGADAATILHDEQALAGTVMDLLGNPDKLKDAQESAHDFVIARSDMVERTLQELSPLLAALQTRKKSAS